MLTLTTTSKEDIYLLQTPVKNIRDPSLSHLRKEQVKAQSNPTGK
jgi:hypothetical protein